MGRIIIFPYKMFSGSSRQLAESLRNTQNDTKIVRVYADRHYSPRNNDFIVNWGNSIEPDWAYNTILNKPSAVALAVDKIKTFNKLKEMGVRTVPYTLDYNEAVEWDLICERHLTRAYGGRGIRISDPSSLNSAPLYTKFMPNSEEYRVHVFKGEVIDYSKKYKRIDGELVFSNDGYVKNRANGWEFLREVEQREGVSKRAIEAVEALGLDFGAVDVIRHRGDTGWKSYVLEVGTACGLSPKGVQAYTNKIIEYADF